MVRKIGVGAAHEAAAMILTAFREPRQRWLPEGQWLFGLVAMDCGKVALIIVHGEVSATNGDDAVVVTPEEARLHGIEAAAEAVASSLAATHADLGPVASDFGMQIWLAAAGLTSARQKFDLLAGVTAQVDAVRAA